MLKQLVIAAGLVVGTSTTAAAALFGPNQYVNCVGLQACTVGLFSASANNDDATATSGMIVQDFRNFDTLGVASSRNGVMSRDKEIQRYHGESLVISLATPRWIKALEVGHLYSPDEPTFLDPPEVAEIYALLEDNSVQLLKLVAETTDPDGFTCGGDANFATCNRVVPTTGPRVGNFRITDVFSQRVKQLTFTGPIQDPDAFGGGSDYAMRLVETVDPAPIPLPATGWMALGGLAGLIGMRWLRRQKRA